MKKIIDKYSLNARFYPMVLFYLPVLLLGILFSLQFDKYTHLLTSLGILGAMSFFLQQIGRDPGKSKERALWKTWGGPPSTRILRWRDDTIDVNTKKRYHLKLQALCPLDVVPNTDFEKQWPIDADSAYEAWAKYLRSKTRDTKKYSLLFTENINYGYRRNLWGLKSYAISLLIFLMVATYGYSCWANKIFNPLDFSAPFFIGEIMLLILLSLWLLKVRADWVKIPADAYAERLLESTESLKNDTAKNDKTESKPNPKTKKK